jgi:hypothetical protein
MATTGLEAAARRRYPEAELRQSRQVVRKGQTTETQQGGWSVCIGRGLASREIGYGATEALAWQIAADAVQAEIDAGKSSKGRSGVPPARRD